MAGIKLDAILEWTDADNQTVRFYSSNIHAEILKHELNQESKRKNEGQIYGKGEIIGSKFYDIFVQIGNFKGVVRVPTGTSQELHKNIDAIKHVVTCKLLLLIAQIDASHFDEMECIDIVDNQLIFKKVVDNELA